MKILSLTFSGVRSYPGTCGPIDFTGKSLVGILGDTGAGKTSILEAITAALYGKCSWTDRAAQLRSDGCPAMMVELTFSVEGREWRVHRVFHESRPTQARLTDPDGKHTNGVRPVDEAVKTLIGIDYAAFKSSVLVPQGRFDELLNSGDAERTGILKSLFGIDELQHVRQLAGEASSRLNGLLNQARLEDARLHDDPRAQAQAAFERREKADHGAADLADRLGQLRQLQTQAAQTQQHARLSTDAASALSGRRVTDHRQITAAALQAQDELHRLQETNTEADTAARADLKAVTAKRDEATASGLDPDALATAAQILRDVPGRLAALAEERTAHALLLAELEEEVERLARRAADLEHQEQHLDMLRGQLGKADDEAVGAAEVLQTLTAAVRRAGEAAAALAQQRDAQALSQSRLTALLETPPGSDLDQAGERLRDAQRTLEAVRRSEAAHTAGDGLSAGDGCPVCARPLPQDYQPPRPQDADTLEQARAAADAAAAALTAAQREHTRHTHEVEQLHLAQDEHRRQVQTASDRLAEALPPVGEQAQELATRSAHPQPGMYAKELEAALTAALSGITDTPPAAQREELLETLLADAHARVAQLQQVAAGSRAGLAAAETELAAGRASLEAAERAADLGREQARKTEERLDSGQHSVLASLSALPEFVRAHLPTQPALPAAEHLNAAAGVVRREQDRQEELAARQEQLRALVESLLAEQGELAERRRREVADPLHRLAARLQRWADSAHTAATLVDEPQRPALPSPAGMDDPTAAERYAAALDAASTPLLAALDEHQTAAHVAMAELTAQLAAHADALTAAYPHTPVLQVGAATDPLDSTLLDGLSSQAGTLRGEAERARQDQASALSQIPHKDQLTAAITAGERQLAAWQAVSTQLTDGRFLGHLTDLRTRALLAHGSELLRQLSGGRLGFAANFDIVNLTSHTRRDSRTLSGGETFQASLALSLALMEMHGRNGTRLESLFLDEGFGTLDTASLDSALQVLRAHVGPDKLLAVISHLRPVAETVHDVLWVKKDHCGSQARWLTPAQRDTLIREDLHNLADLA